MPTVVVGTVIPGLTSNDGATFPNGPSGPISFSSPPDTIAAASNTRIVEAVNSALRIIDRSDLTTKSQLIFPDFFGALANPAYSGLLSRGYSAQYVAYKRVLDDSAPNLTIIDGLYNKYLRRDADVSGEVYWVNALANNQTTDFGIIYTFLGLVEYKVYVLFHPLPP